MFSTKIRFDAYQCWNLMGQPKYYLHSGVVQGCFRSTYVDHLRSAKLQHHVRSARDHDWIPLKFT